MSGHFIAYCKSPTDNNWYRYNDAEVTQCQKQNVMYEINSNGIPYVLYYQRNNNITSTEVKNGNIPLDNNNYSNTEKKKDVLDFNYKGKEGFTDLNIEDNKLLYEIYYEVANKFDFLPKEANYFYIKRNNNKIPIDPYKGVKDNGLKNNDKIFIGNNNNNQNTMDVLVFTYEGKETNINLKIEENNMFLQFVFDLKNKKIIPQEEILFL